MLDADKYIRNPCRALATAFWKAAHFPLPPNVRIFHNHDACSDFTESATAYFRLYNDLRIQHDIVLPSGFHIRQIQIPHEAQMVADMINRCYPGYNHTADGIIRWTDYPVFDADLWLFVWDELTNSPAASGIADFDKTIAEGSLEWIQVLPEYRGRSFGQAIVMEILNRLKRGKNAAFATVSGECNNATNPEKLYRKCGFIGDDVWYVKNFRG